MPYLIPSCREVALILNPHVLPAGQAADTERFTEHKPMHSSLVIPSGSIVISKELGPLKTEVKRCHSILADIVSSEINC